MDEKQETVKVKEPTDSFFDYSGCSFTAFYPKNNTHLCNPDLLNLKPMISSVDTPNSLLLHTMTMGSDLYCDFSELSGEDSDAKSDTATSPCRLSDGVDAFSHDDVHRSCVDVDAILYDEHIKKKLQVLAAMIGITDSAAGPVVVLAEVVSVLKNMMKGEKRDVDGIFSKEDLSV